MMLVDNFPTLQGKSNVDHFLQELSKDLTRFATEVTSVKELLKGVKTVDELVSQISSLEQQVSSRKAELVQVSNDLSSVQSKHSETEANHQQKLEALTTQYKAQHQKILEDIGAASARRDEENRLANIAADKHLKARQDLDALRRSWV